MQYLSGGAGSVGGFFVHEKHANNFDIPRMIGWWAHKMDTRFEMTNSKYRMLLFNAHVMCHVTCHVIYYVI